jgi:hypothetical protein
VTRRGAMRGLSRATPLRCIFEQIRLGPCPDRFEYRFIIIQGSQHQHLRTRLRKRDFTRRRHTALDGHV